MNKILISIFTLSFFISGTSAQATVSHKKPFKNCTAVNAKYPGGIASSKKAVNVGGTSKFSPKVDKKLYKKLKGMDRDKDGIACEK